MHNKPGKTKKSENKCKRAEEALPESENFYRNLFENTATAVVILDEDNTILLGNGACEKLTGYTRQEVEGKKKWTDFIVQKDDLERMKEYQGLRRIDSLSAPQTYEFQFVDREGQVKDIVVNVRTMPGRKQTLATLLDVTDRNRANAALRESERRLTDVIDFLPDATFAVDLSGKIIAWNRAMEEMSGAKAADMLGKGDHEYTIPFYGKRIPALIDLALGFNEELEEKYDFVKKEGDVLLAEAEMTALPIILWGKARPLYDSHGNIVGAIESLRDITERRRMEAALTESERRLADIIDFLPDATFAVDLSGKIIAWNRAMEEMSGANAADMLGKGNHEYAIPFYGMRRPVLIDLALGFNKGLEEKYDFVKRKGNVLLTEAEMPALPIVLWAKAGPLYDSCGNIVGAIESLRDITEQKRTKVALQVEISERIQVEKERETLILELKGRTKNLQEVNTTLSVLLQKREEDKNILEERFVENIGGLVLPYVEMIKKNNLDVQQQLCLDIIETNLGYIITPLLKNIQQFKLTPREIQVASLINNGKSTKEIAQILGIGKGSIDTHRKSIRKKLGLDRTSNLQSHLRFLEK
jgi:PAS domain S-box-containing protein